MTGRSVQPDGTCRRIFPDEEGTESGRRGTKASPQPGRRIFPDEEGTESARRPEPARHDLGSQNLPR